MHDLGEVMAGYAVLLADVSDRELTALTFGQIQNREYRKPSGSLQLHNDFIRLAILLNRYPSRAGGRAQPSSLRREKIAEEDEHHLQPLSASY